MTNQAGGELRADQGAEGSPSGKRPPGTHEASPPPNEPAEDDLHEPLLRVMALHATTLKPTLGARVRWWDA